MDKQQLLMDSLDAALAWNTETNDEGVYKLQASAVCIDNAAGYVTAIVGGRNQGLPGYTLNRAYQSFRQPGSAIKPLVVYAPYLGLGHNPDELIDDSPMEGGPENFENRYPGEETLQEALAWSSNVAAWKLFEQITPEYGMSFVKRCISESLVMMSITWRHALAVGAMERAHLRWRALMRRLRVTEFSTNLRRL